MILLPTAAHVLLYVRPSCVQYQTQFYKYAAEMELIIISIHGKNYDLLKSYVGRTFSRDAPNFRDDSHGDVRLTDSYSGGYCHV